MFPPRARFAIPLIAFAIALAAPPATDAQGVLGRMKKKAEEAAKKKVEERTEKKAGEVTDAMLDKVECKVSDRACVDKAQSEGKQVVVTDESGAVVTGGASVALKPGEGAWANYDFKPGDRILFADDFSKDEVGDFPKRLEFRAGQIEIVEWNGGRWLRAGSSGEFLIALSEPLPERFTLEFDVAGSGNAMLLMFDGGSHSKRMWVGQTSGSLHSGEVRAEGSFGVDTKDKPVHIAISVDGKHVKMYANERRVFNAPNGDMGRSSKIHVNMNPWSAEDPRLIANLRIAAGGKKLYDALSEKGRVATQGILFDVGSDRIRPESTPTLKEIGQMLTEHADLKLTIEGHTDNVGSAQANHELSHKRADAVKAYLVTTYRLDESRLTSTGFGDKKPVAKNDTPEGRQQNRRVELVKM